MWYKIFFIIFSSIYLLASQTSTKKIDDWEYNQTISMQKGGMISSLGTPQPVSSPMVMRKSLGFSVGGAKDANNFYENIKKGYLPKISSITYEGVFYDHRFEITAKQKCKDLFCPKYQTAVRNEIFSGKKEYFLSVGLDSNIDSASFKRKRLNLVVVMDISGSMSSPFDRYYYDKKHHKKNSKKSKMQIANRSIANMTKHLKTGDRFGVVLFDNRAYLAKPLREVEKTDMDAIREHILELKPRGGTNWSEGYKKAINLYKDLTKDKDVENRIIFITDAMPNRGELAKDRLFGMVKEAAKDGIYTTFIGVGVDFNSDLVEYITKTKGANYLSIHSSKEFKKRVDKEFEYLVTPLVFDLKLELLSDAFSISKIYGSASNQKNSNSLIEISTLFPSSNTKDGVKGGIVLVKLDRKGIGDITLKVSYKDRDGKSHQNIKKVNFENGYYYGGSAIQKAIILTDYVNIIKNWLIDTRESCNDQVKEPEFELLRKRCVLPPKIPQKISIWERRSCPLKISNGYKKLFYIFLKEFQRQKYLLRDPSLKKEEDLLKFLVEYSKRDKREDDWNFIR